ncbi:hypothetical protein K1719_031318 [Acacia pycnantha]|nr:hypothetical protein K1719_031318 [Acacia pycnantha]
MYSIHRITYLEGIHFKEGYDEGYNDGLIAGKDEAKLVDFKVGFEVGQELGFYRGCVDVWNSAIRVDPNCFSSRVKIAIKQIDGLVEKYPVLDHEYLELQEIMDSLGLKFKMVSSSLQVKLDYDGYPKSSSYAKDIQF